ncbi:hypothetical protein [Megamonas hypermegale]|uniref:hypothetical protein n=1 Tax=Megamonas hypermegale TaxID=158847 RepID=UPI00320A17D9
MGFTLKIEGNESLFYGENIVQMVTASLDTPNNVRAKSTQMCLTLQIAGKLQADDNGSLNSQTVKLFEWSMIPPEEKDVYRTVTVEFNHGGQCFRRITLDTAFVVDYDERYSTSSGVGDFFMTIRQKSDVLKGAKVEGNLSLSASSLTGGIDTLGQGTGIAGGQTSQMEKIGQAVANAAVQKVLQKVDPSGTLSTVQSNLQR